MNNTKHENITTDTKNIYTFNINDIKNLYSDDKNLLGSKGVGLQKLSELGINVPPGITISTKICEYFYNNAQCFPEGFLSSLKIYIKLMENQLDKVFGGKKPLLLAVRSGAVTSMPGIMDTILNIGMNDLTYNYLKDIDLKFAKDCYRRFIIMFSSSVFGIDKSLFKKECSIEEMKNIVYKTSGKTIPQDVYEQLNLSIKGVMLSCNKNNATNYKKIVNIKDAQYTAITIQSMVFGNLNTNSCSGIAFSRNPNTGTKEPFGEFALRAQGEALVSGECNPQKLINLKNSMPRVYMELCKTLTKLEKKFETVVDIEFTVESEKLWFLQVRPAKKNAQASIVTAIEMISEKIISVEKGVLSLPDNIFDIMSYSQLKHDNNLSTIYLEGDAISFGCAVGEVTFSNLDAIEKKKAGKNIILIREEMNVEDITGMHLCNGMITLKGGKTCHGAIVARSIGVPVVSSFKNSHIENKQLFVGKNIIKDGDLITIDGTNGRIYKEELAIEQVSSDALLNQAINLINKVNPMTVRVNAETISDVKKALSFGAKGIGLCRTEHMFFEKEKMHCLQQIIFTSSKKLRFKLLEKLLFFQTEDFNNIMKIMKGLPINIRLFDPPLHEFIPKSQESIAYLANSLNITEYEMIEKINEIKETNPMLGKRGVRLGIVDEDIYDTQIKAIFDAMYLNNNYKTEIMIPLVSTIEELLNIKNRMQLIAKKYPIKLKYDIGTMIETPRSALIASELAKEVDFFSFGTNDLTQMVYGISRDDFSNFQKTYEHSDIIKQNPFEVLDINGVGQLIKMAIKNGRGANPDLKISICGEQATNKETIEFLQSFDSCINYISCSPYKIASTILISAKNTIKSIK